MRAILLSLTIPAILTGCLTPAKERQFRDDIFSLQTRVLELESQLQQQGKSVQSSGDNANQRIASTSTRLEKMEVEIQRMRGDMDALRVGVVTGQMPGADPDQEGSVAKTLNDLSTRLATVEEGQKQLLDVIEKASAAATGAKATSSSAKGKDKDKDKASDEKAKSYTELKKAFEGKKYKLVAESAASVLDGTKKKAQKEEIVFMWAESLFKNGKLRDAALKFNDFVDMKPSSSKLPQAKMRMGDCFKQLGDKATAKLYYEEIVSQYPNSSEAKKAKEALARL